MATTNTTTIHGQISNLAVRKNIASHDRRLIGSNFPLGGTINDGGGIFARSVGKEAIIQNVRQLLRTERGERIFLPNFGCNLKKFLFQPLDQITFNAITEEIVTSIERYTNNVTITRLQVFPETTNKGS